MATVDDSPRLCRLHVTDRVTGKRFLIDTGSDVSIFRHRKQRERGD